MIHTENKICKLRFEKLKESQYFTFTSDNPKFLYQKIAESYYQGKSFNAIELSDIGNMVLCNVIAEDYVFPTIITDFQVTLQFGIRNDTCSVC